MTTSKQDKTEKLTAQITQPAPAAKATNADEIKPQQPEALVLELNAEPLTDINFGF